MKLTIVVCVALFAIVCYAAEKSEKAKVKAESIDLLKRFLEKKLEGKAAAKTTNTFNSKKTHVKKALLSKIREMRTKNALKLMHRQLDANCNADVEPFGEGENEPDGAWIYYPSYSSDESKKKNRDDTCTFHIKTDEDKVMAYYVDMGMHNDGKADCDDGGKLALWEGSSDSGEPEHYACDEMEYAYEDFTSTNEVYITFTKDAENDIWFNLGYAFLEKSYVASLLEGSEDHTEDHEETGEDHETEEDHHTEEDHDTEDHETAEDGTHGDDEDHETQDETQHESRHHKKLTKKHHSHHKKN